MKSIRELNFSKLWVVEYSVHQNAWHVDSLANSLSANRKHCFEMRHAENDYKILAIVDNHEEAHQLSAEFRKRQQQVQSSKSEPGDAES